MKPFLKWAGGKRWLIQRYPDLFRVTFTRYLEPFLGGGAVFFHLNPRESILSDLNPRLITTYQALKADYKRVELFLREHACKHSDRYYYDVRERRYRSDFQIAAQFIYLNRTCWNGLYRENLNGVFNVPRGTKNNVIAPDDDFRTVAERLMTASIKMTDFEETIGKAGSGDFIFVDPPYTVKHNQNGFVKYNEKIFSWNDQLRLVASLRKAAKSGATILVTNANHPSILEQYIGLGSIFTGERASVLSADSRYRGETSEAIILIGSAWKRDAGFLVSTKRARRSPEAHSL